MKLKYDHELKIDNIFFEAKLECVKAWEYRKNDRNFCVGDTVLLKEYDSVNKKYSGRYLFTLISYIYDHGNGYVIYSDVCPGVCVLRSAFQNV